MILVNLSRSWKDVIAGDRDAASVTLGEWAGIKDDSLDQYADVIAGVFRGEVVSIYDISGWTRDETTGRITFRGEKSDRWGHLIGTPNPGADWVQGAARPVKYLDTDVLTEGNVRVEEVPDGDRAVVRGYTLTVDDEGHATVLVPPGGRVTVAA